MLEFPAIFENGEALSYYRMDAENRACNKIFPLKLHIPYYIDKYGDYRAKNKDFRRFFDLQMLYRLYPYALTSFESDRFFIAKAIHALEIQIP